MGMTEDTRSTERTVGAPWTGRVTIGRNGVPIAPRAITKGAGYRTYEVHQRMRVKDSTEKLNPMRIVSADFARDPYPALQILREHYPCYRDWVANSYWVSRYDDVTSIFQDDANFETRPKTWFYGIEGYGRDLRQERAVLKAQAACIDAHAEGLAKEIVAEFARAGETDLAIEFAARYPLELLARQLDLPREDFDDFVERYWRMQRGHNWNPQAEQEGLTAIGELTKYFRPLFAERRKSPGNDLISSIATLETEGPLTTAEDLVITLLEGDHETMHGALANLWYLLLTHPDQLALISKDRRLVKYAYFEALRHSAPVLTAKRFARHEVERFGFLLPEGALVRLSAAAANRDPRIFSEPDRYMVMRTDLCQREPRGQYRADGLPAGIAFGLGKPSKFPAEPEDRPRSLYAITRDTVVRASNVLLDSLPNIRIKPGASPELCCLRLDEMHTCWNLPVEFDA